MCDAWCIIYTLRRIWHSCVLGALHPGDKKKKSNTMTFYTEAQMQIYVHIGAGGFPGRDPSFKQEQADLDQGRPVSPRV